MKSKTKMLFKLYIFSLAIVVAIKTDNYSFMTNYVNNFAKNDKLKVQGELP